jgi:hypothetical protein
LKYFAVTSSGEISGACFAQLTANKNKKRSAADRIALRC